MNKLILISLLLFTAQLATAEDYKGEKLLGDCTAMLKLADLDDDSPDNKARASHCVSYVMGYLAGLEVQAGISETALFFCAPEDIMPLDIMRLVVSYLAGHPEMLGEERGVGITLALMEEFPCSGD